MSHIIDAIILKGEYNIEKARKYDLNGIKLDFNLTMFFIDDDFLIYWEKKLNIRGFLETNCTHVNKMVIYELMKLISKTEQVEYAVISTAYVGGMGDQYANVYQDNKNVDLSINTINAALKYLGVQETDDLDEFDVVGLGRFRRNPDYLNKYHLRSDEWL